MQTSMTVVPKYPPAEREVVKRKLNTAADALWAALLHEQPHFQLDEFNRPVLNAFAYWLVKEPFNDITVGKGIHLTGPVGTGKTLLMQAASRAMVLGGAREGFAVVNAMSIVHEFNLSDDGRRDRSTTGGDHVIIRYGDMPRLCIDDVAMERDGKHYGREANVIGDIINRRYERWRNGGCITHITTNGDPEILAKKYDMRTLTRLSEMCGDVYLGGPNRRPTAAPPAKVYVMPDLFEAEEVRPMPTEEETRAHFQRIRESINAAIESVDAQRQPREVVPLVYQSQGEHLTGFAAGLEALDLPAVRELRQRIERNNIHNPGAATPYLAAIDAYLKAAHSTDAVVVPELAPEAGQPTTAN